MAQVAESLNVSIWTLLARYRRQLLYFSSGLIVVVSFLLWFNFNSPPINSNLGFDLYPWRQVVLTPYAFNPYLWPGSYVPWALGAPPTAYYGAFYTLAGNRYSVGLFASYVVLDTIGGLCLFYLTALWLTRFQIRAEYALFGVLVYAFNDYKLLSGFGTTNGYFSTGYLTPGDPAVIIILAFLTFLTLFRNSRFVLLLGGFSFLAFSTFPTGSLALSQEYFALLLIFLAFRWGNLAGARLRHRFVIVTKDGLLVVGTIIAANAYLAYPLILTLGSYTSALSSSNPTYAFTYAFDAQQGFANSVRLISNWAAFGSLSPPWAVEYLTAPLPVLLSFLVPFLALGATLFLRRSSDLILYGLMLIVLLLSTSTNSPISSIFVLLTTDVPPFRVFYDGEVLTPLLLCFYCLFVPLSVARGASFLQQLESPGAIQTPSPRGHLARWRKRAGQPLTRAVSTYGWPSLIAVLLLVSAYPALSPHYSQEHSSDYPVSSALPTYYREAANYLESTNPMSPTMVFPLVEPFDSNAVNGSIWYDGVNLYPNLIPNPSISSTYPDNYEGQDGNNLPIPGFVYGIGGSICASPNCVDGGISPVPSLSSLRANQSADFSTNNTSVIHWTVPFPSDQASFSVANDTQSLIFRVNASVAETDGHWILGLFPSAQNLSRYSYALINFTLTGTSPSRVQFGFHSFSTYGAGNGYFLGNYTVLQDEGSAQTVLIPLKQPSINVSGILTNVTNLFFVSDAPTSNGIVTLTVHSLTFVPAPPDVAPTWKAGNVEDQLNLTTRAGATGFTFRINKSIFEPNGHWALGSFTQGVDLSAYDFAVVNYTLSNVDPARLQFGYHSDLSDGPGDGFTLSDYLTTALGGSFTTVIPLAAPTISAGGTLTDVTNLFFVYTPLEVQSAFGYVNVSSIRFSHSDQGGGLVLGSALNRMGIEFAYVDTSVVDTNYPNYAGNFYNTVFGNSSSFAEVFHAGTVTIYRNLLYSGVVASPERVAPEVLTNATLDGLSFPFSNIYYNASNLGTSYISAGEAAPLASMSATNVSAFEQISPIEYSATVSSPQAALLELKTQFDQGWVAELPNGTSVSTHLLVDGYANGWIIPRGTYVITLVFKGAPSFSQIEIITLAIPPLLMVGFGIAWYRRRHAFQPRFRSQGVSREAGADPDRE